MADYQIDKNTKNLSFRRIYYYIQNNESCNNYDFLLKTINPELLDFDYDEFMSRGDNKANQRSIIKNECRENIWFFFREIVRIPNDMNYIYSIPSNTRYVLNLTEMKMIYAYDNCKGFVTFNPKVNSEENAGSGTDIAGITTTLCLLKLYEDYIISDGYNSSIYWLNESSNDNIIYNRHHSIMTKLLSANDHIIFTYLETKPNIITTELNDEVLSTFIYKTSLFCTLYNDNALGNSLLAKLIDIIDKYKGYKWSSKTDNKGYQRLYIDISNIIDEDLSSYSKKKVPMILSRTTLEKYVRDSLFKESLKMLDNEDTVSFKLFDNLHKIPNDEMIIIPHSSLNYYCLISYGEQ